MLKVFFENRYIIICRKDEIPSGVREEQTILYTGIESIRDIPARFDTDTDVEALYIASEDPQQCFDQFCTLFTEINAGGGLVSNDRREYLMIFRRGMWDLPKGKQEMGESIEQCAAREVMEETGLSDVTVGDLLSITHHTYHLDGNFILKHTWWFKMDCLGDDSLTPQFEEEINRAQWMTRGEVIDHAPLCYKSVKEVIDAI